MLLQSGTLREGRVNEVIQTLLRKQFGNRLIDGNVYGTKSNMRTQWSISFSLVILCSTGNNDRKKYIWIQDEPNCRLWPILCVQISHCHYDDLNIYYNSWWDCDWNWHSIWMYFTVDNMTDSGVKKYPLLSEEWFPTSSTLTRHFVEHSSKSSESHLGLL